MMDICFDGCIAILQEKSALSLFIQRYKKDWRGLSNCHLDKIGENMSVEEQAQWIKGLLVFITEFYS